MTGNAALLRKVYVPKYIFTFAKVTSCMLDLVFSLGALLIVMVATGAPFYWQILLSPACNHPALYILAADSVFSWLS